MSFPAQRPTDVTNALRLLVASMVLDIVAFAFSGTYAWAEFLGLGIGLGIAGLLLVQLGKARHWARVVLAVLVGLGVVAGLVWFAESYRENPGETVLSTISTVILLVATVLLFTAPSNDWFAQKSKSTY